MRACLLALSSLVFLAPAVGLACDIVESDLYRINPGAIVEQPDPPPIMTVSAQATLSPAIAGGCSDDACPDGSGVIFSVTLAPEHAGRFGYQIELIDPDEHVPFIRGGLAPLDASDPYEVAVLWGSNAQYQASAFRARLRTINLKGELGPWSETITIRPAQLDGQPASLGWGSLSLLILLGLGLRRRRA